MISAIMAFFILFIARQFFRCIGYPPVFSDSISPKNLSKRGRNAVTLAEIRRT